MTGYTWAAVGMIAAGTAVYAADVLIAARRRAPHDRVRLTCRERLTWLRFRRRFDRDLRRQVRAIDRIQAEIAETERRLRDCLGEGGGA